MHRTEPPPASVTSTAAITGRYRMAPSFFDMAPDYLCTQAESLIRALSERAPATPLATPASPDAIVDGYAHVLALDVDRLRLEREIARLAESGDPRVAGELRELSILLRRVKHTSDQLRDQLSSVRAQAELAG